MEMLNPACIHPKTWKRVNLTMFQLDEAEQAHSNSIVKRAAATLRLIKTTDLGLLKDSVSLHLEITWARLEFYLSSTRLADILAEVLSTGWNLSTEPTTYLQWHKEAICLEDALKIENRSTLA